MKTRAPCSRWPTSGTPPPRSGGVAEALIGDDARAVTVLTCHGFAMCLVGAGFAGRAEPFDDDAFLDVVKQTVVRRAAEGCRRGTLTRTARDS